MAENTKKVTNGQSGRSFVDVLKSQAAGAKGTVATISNESAIFLLQF
ncbi:MULTISPECIES: hypothetical protein [Alteromonas]|nr:hypothetical protein [Alteromonas macleodii]